MARMPWFSFYPGDWLSDSNLSRCSIYARGLWIDVLALAYQCENPGILASDGKPWSDDQICLAIRGGKLKEKLAALDELLQAKVARRMIVGQQIPGAVYSKRMLSDIQNRDKTSNRVKKYRDRNALVTQVSRDCNADVTDLSRECNRESQKSDIRSQKSEVRQDSLSLGSKPKREASDPDAQPWDRWPRWDELRELLDPMTPHRDVYRSKFEGALDATIHNATRAGLDPEVHQDAETFVAAVLRAAKASGKAFESAKGFEAFALSVMTRCVASRCMPDQWPDAASQVKTAAPDMDSLLKSARKTGAARYA